MARLPDLAIGAVVRAVEAARAEGLPRAPTGRSRPPSGSIPAGRRWPSPSATVARCEGRLAGSCWPACAGYPPPLHPPLGALALAAEPPAWGLALLLLTGGLFVAVQMAAKGGALLQDLTRPLRPRLPRPARGGVGLRRPALAARPAPRASLAAALLVGPPLGLLLGERAGGAGRPSGCWSALRRCSLDRAARQVAVAPLAARARPGEPARSAGSTAACSPTSACCARCCRRARRSSTCWPTSTARSGSGTWPARSTGRCWRRSRRTPPALLDLGAYFFLKGDFGAAIEHFQQAAETDPGNAAAQFNLSQATTSPTSSTSRARPARRPSSSTRPGQRWVRTTRSSGWCVERRHGPHPRDPPRAAGELGGRRRRAAAGLVRRGPVARRGPGLVLVAVAAPPGPAAAPATRSRPPSCACGSGALDRWRRFLLPGVRLRRDRARVASLPRPPLPHRPADAAALGARSIASLGGMIRATRCPGSSRSGAWRSTSGCGSAWSCATESDAAARAGYDMAVEGTLDLFKLPEILQWSPSRRRPGS